MADNQSGQSKRPQKAENGQPTPGKYEPRLGDLCSSIVDSLPVGVVTFDLNLRITDANSQAAALVALNDFVDIVLAKGTNNPGAHGLDWTDQLRAVLSDGHTRIFDSVSYTLHEKTRLLKVVCTPLKKLDTTEILGGAVIIEDITEKADMERQLANTEKLAAVGKLASKVAHELNNPLDGILRYINLALRFIEKENLEKPRQYLVQCRTGIMRMVNIVSELLEFARGTHAPFEYVKLEHLIEDAIRTIFAESDAFGVRILRDYGPNIPQIRTGNLFQVFCNLVKNAFDAMPNGGELRISTRLGPDNAVIIEFRDTGVGFPPENADVIFEPFFTTKEKGKGTGLGLAICKDIVESCHGRISAQSLPEGGSVFTVRLPAGGQT